jgi:hypothetical protein
VASDDRDHAAERHRLNVAWPRSGID